MTDQLNALAASLADRYRVERLLGEGGMATVYLAHDLKHERQVAVKVLRPELAAAIGPERFLREITTMAALRHPHLLPLYDSGMTEGGDGTSGFLFYVMPYVEGESLRDRMDREKQLPLQDAQQIAREMADALAYAHSHDVVHRDIKPENILLESGHAVLADFGISRAIGAAGGEQLTQTGLSVGTPGYMSPEQASGGSDVDGRSDIYSLGCVLFEMLAGQPPFTGPTVESIVRQHLTSDPPSITDMRTTVAPHVAAAIARSLTKAPADRYATAVEFGEALEESEVVTASRSSEAVTGSGHRWLLPATAVAVVAIVAGSFFLSSSGPPVSGRPTLAVLPFENLGAPDDEYFADGITEEMTSRLAEISGLGVISRTSAIRYKDTDKNLRDIASELGVAYVVEGTVRTDRAVDGTGQVRVTPHLIRVSDDTHLWTERYTASLAPGEIFSVQADIAEQVAAALDVTLLGGERTKLAHAPTTDREAHEAYLLGRFHWKKRTGDDLQRAAEHFQRAIARDPDFAEAHAGLADAYGLFGYYVPGTSRPDAYARAEAAARRAITLDSTLAEAHASLGNILSYGRWDWEAADSAFQRAIALDPEYAVARYWYAEMLMIVGRREDAVTHAERAVELDPASPVARHLLGMALLYAGRSDESLVQVQKSVELEPLFVFGHGAIGFAHALRGDSVVALRELQLSGWGAEIAQPLARLWSDSTAAGELAQATRRLDRDRPLGVDAYTLGLAYALAGELDSAFARFDEAFVARSEAMVFDMRSPLYDVIRSDPRYSDLMKRMGLNP